MKTTSQIAKFPALPNEASYKIDQVQKLPTTRGKYHSVWIHVSRYQQLPLTLHH